MDTYCLKDLAIKPLNLRVNRNLPNFAAICQLLKSEHIPFTSWEFCSGFEYNSMEMSFTNKSNFKNVYILAYILKDYGLEYIYPSRRDYDQIAIGTNLNDAIVPEMYALAEPISIDSFLNIVPNLNTKQIIKHYFKNKYIYTGVILNNHEEIVISSVVETNRDDENEAIEYWNPEDYEKYNDDLFYKEQDEEAERQTFDELTNGEFGRYDDFDGDISDVRIWLGRD